MTIEIRGIAADELRKFADTCEAAFGEIVRDEDFAVWEKLFEVERGLAAYDDDVMVGTAGAYSFSLAVPGGELPAAGVTVVAVLPTHRRKGILTQMMREQLDDVRARGEPLAILWASEASIYHRFGYGLASLYGRLDLEREQARFRDTTDARGKVRFLTVEEAAKTLPAIYDRVQLRTPGMYRRSHDWWVWHRLRDREHERAGASPLYCAVLELDGRAEGYALYHVRPDWDIVSKARVEVREAIAASATATREIWRFLFGIDLVERIQAPFLPVDHPLLLMLAEPRRLGFTLSDALWLRVVDLEAALSGRSYSCDGSLVFEVTDELCSRNEGRWRLEVSGSEGRVRRTSDAADLQLDIWDIGSVYLGGFDFTRLADAGRIRELTPGATSTASAMFHIERAPWCPEIF